MTRHEIDIAINNAIESSERYRDGAKRSIIAQKVMSDWEILTEMHISHREEMLTLYRNNREIREKLLNHANELFGNAIIKKDIELADIARKYYNQAHSVNPFL